MINKDRTKDIVGDRRRSSDLRFRVRERRADLLQEGAPVDDVQDEK